MRSNKRQNANVLGASCLNSCLIRMTVGNLLAVYLLLVDGVPSIDDVCQDEGDEQADEGHGAQRELTGAGVDDGQ